ncbi:glycosyltransferase family 2 protein [Rhizobium sp. PAMB 3182]
MTRFEYAYPSKDAKTEVQRLSRLRLLLASYDSWRISRRQKRKPHAVEMKCERPGGPTELTKSDMPLIFLTHNDRKFIPSFLKHYRGLGVTRFICVDDQSCDGTREYLLSQPDVDLWTSPVRYRSAKRGRIWRLQLFSMYGKGRWYLNVDSDEYLMFPNCGQQSLRALVSKLEQMGELRLAAPMLDMYPVGDLSKAVFDGADEQMPWEVADHFDASGYSLRVKKRALSLNGGPRARKFGGANELMKYPLLYWDDRCGLPTNIHTPMPFERNLIPVRGVLLHFKFFSDYREKIEEAIRDKQYFSDAAAYQNMSDNLGGENELNFDSDLSCVFVNEKQLSDMGFFVK